MPVVFEKLTHTYMPGSMISVTALSDISFTIEDGEIFSIIGHTGSGKSTLVQHINGLLMPSSGTVTVNGLPLNDKKSRKQVRTYTGMMFQYPEYQLFEETVYKDVAFGPSNSGIKGSELDDCVKSAMEKCRLDFDKYSQKSPFELSGGEKRRVAIAGVLASNPRILILDEPIAGLDPRGRVQTIELIRELNAQAVTIIMISHNMDDVAALSDRIAVLNKGSLYCIGTPSEVFGRAQELSEIGLDLPMSAQLGNRLRARGINAPQNCVEMNQIIDFLGASHV